MKTLILLCSREPKFILKGSLTPKGSLSGHLVKLYTNLCSGYYK